VELPVDVAQFAPVAHLNVQVLTPWHILQGLLESRLLLDDAAIFGVFPVLAAALAWDSHWSLL
jgi:hypothetical protein